MLQNPTLKNAMVHPSAEIAVSKLAHDNTPVGLNAGMISYADVTISATAVKAAYTTPVSLVATPGAGYINLFQGARVTLDYGTAAYASVNDAVIAYTNGSGQVCATLTASGFLDATSDQVRFLYPVAAAAFTPVANAALVFAIGTANPTTGDSPLKVRIFYRTIPTGL